MSDSLDKFFRDQQANIPSATPPPGQWERIQEGKLIVEPTVKRSASLWWLVLAMGVGLGLGVPIGAYSFVEQCPAVAADTRGVPVSAPVAPKPETRGANLAPSTALAPAAAPKDRDAHTLSGFTPESKDTPILAASGNIDEQMVEHDARSATPMVQKELKSSAERAKMQPTKTSREAPETMAEALSVKSEKRKTTVETKVADQASVTGLPAFAQTPVASTQFGALQHTLVRAATNTKVVPVEIKGRKPRSLARWEAGLSVMPTRTRPLILSQNYTETANGSSVAVFEFEGRDVNLYYDGIPDLDALRRLTFRSVSIEGARQFENGLRLGLELTWSSGSPNQFQEVRGFFENRLSAGEWATFYEINGKSLSSTIFTDYTFLRRRRFRPYLGLMVTTPVYSVSEFEHYLFEKNSGRIEPLGNITSVYGFDEILISPVQLRLGFQYDLSDRLSLGLGSEYAPFNMKIGGRWKL